MPKSISLLSAVGGVVCTPFGRRAHASRVAIKLMVSVRLVVGMWNTSPKRREQEAKRGERG